VSPRGNFDPPCNAPYPVSDDGNGGDCRQNEQVIESTVAPPIIVSMRLHYVQSRNEKLLTSGIDSSSIVKRVQAWKTTVCRGVILLYKLLLII
jgi:cell wall assembly regulator SMI1